MSIKNICAEVHTSEDKVPAVGDGKSENLSSVIKRPELHFTPQKNWINDPNGLLFHEGEYHLFYQHNPFGRQWGHMSWGHAVSRDLISWQELDVAIAEGSDGAIFSGSAVFDSEDSAGFGRAIVAIYTNNIHEKNQSQHLAFSTDNGRTFTKYQANPVLDRAMKDFRDPKVFRYRGQWRMVVALPHQHQIAIYGSENLKSWSLLSEFGPVAAAGGVWECPDLFPLQISGEEVWVLLVSLNPGGINNGSGTQYFIGSFDGEKFTARYETTNPRWLDYGRDNYAGVTFNDAPDGARIFIGWMQNWQEEKTSENPWVGAMTIPRKLGLLNYNGEIVLTQQPVIAPTEVFTINPGQRGIEYFTSKSTDLKNSVGYDHGKRELFCNGYVAPLEILSEPVKICALLDHGSIELYSADGRIWLTMATNS